MSTHLRQSVAKRHNTMSDDLKFQLRLTLSDEFAQVARNDPGDPSISTLTDILNRYYAVMKCQFDAFAGYVSEAEAQGVENFHGRGGGACPLRPESRQTNDRFGMSALCHKQTHAPQHKHALFDHLVGAGE
jgi:hypothetical protein